MSEVKFRREYKIRKQQPSQNSVEVTVPIEVIEREARLHDMTADEFMDHFIAICEFGNEGGVSYTFAPSNNCK